MLRALWMCCAVSAFTIVSFVTEGPSRSNQANFRVRVTFSEAVRAVSASAITITKGSDLRSRPNLPPNLDYDTDFTVDLNNFVLDTAATTLNFTATVKASAPSLEVPFFLQIAAGTLQSRRTSGTGPDSARGLLLIYDTKAPIVNVTSLVGAFSNKEDFAVDMTFGEQVVELTMQDVTIRPATGVSYEQANLTLTNQSLGQYTLMLLRMSGEGQVDVTINSVADVAGNLNQRNGTVSMIRDVTPAVLTLVSDGGPYVSGDSFGVSITSNEPVQQFDDQALIITIAQGRGAAGHTPLQMLSSDNTRFALTVTGIAPAAENDGTFAPNLTVSLQVKEGGLLDRAGNPSPPKDSPAREIFVVVDVRGQNGTVISSPVRPDPVVLSDPVQRVGSISVGALIGIVCGLGALLICCVILVCLKRRKEANEAPDAFKKYGRQVYAEYGVPAPAGLTLEQIVDYGIENGYDEQRSRVAAQRLLKAADTNGDGFLSSDEFIAWLATVIHQQNKTKYKTPPGQDRKLTHRDVLTLKKVFPLKNVSQKKIIPAKRVGVSPGLGEEDPMIKRPVGIHV